MNETIVLQVKTIMKILKVTRKKKFAGAVLPYWIIFHKSKTEFMSEIGLEGDACSMSEAGFPIEESWY